MASTHYPLLPLTLGLGIVLVMGPAVPGCARGRSHLGVWSWPHCGPTQQCTYILGGHTRSTVWSWAQLWRHGVVGTQLWVLWCVTCGYTHVAVVVCCGAALRAKKIPRFLGGFLLSETVEKFDYFL